MRTGNDENYECLLRENTQNLESVCWTHWHDDNTWFFMTKQINSHGKLNSKLWGFRFYMLLYTSCFLWVYHTQKNFISNHIYNTFSWTRELLFDDAAWCVIKFIKMMNNFCNGRQIFEYTRLLVVLTCFHQIKFGFLFG